MGMIATEAHRPHVGEFHYRRAMELLEKPSPILFANLAWNLKNQGRMEESRSFYQQSVALDPDIFQTLYGWAQMEETDRNFSRAAGIARRGGKIVAEQSASRPPARGPLRTDQGLRQGGRDPRGPGEPARRARPGAARMEPEGAPARQDGPPSGSLRRLRRGQARLARNHRTGLSREAGRRAREAAR